MGSSDEGKSTKVEKSSSPAPPDQTNIHVYPDWAAMQAYYGPRVALPPYYNSAMASGHAPHPYMWGPPQPMMPPYGAPYAAVYSTGGVYAHPAVPIGSPPGHGVPISPAAVTAPNMETPIKSNGHADQGSNKKLKGFDGLAMSIGNGNHDTESAECGEQMSQNSEAEGSTDGSDGNTTLGRKRSRTRVQIAEGEIRNETQAGGANASSDSTMVVVVPSTGVSGKSVGSAVSPNKSTTLELHNTPVPGTNVNAASVQPCMAVPPEAWMQNEREVKRERRKQSNRESARRSRLRKQAETEELARKVESLTSENLALKSEMNEMSAKSEKLRLENAALLDKLKNSKLRHTQDSILSNNDEERASAVSTENLLSRVDNSASVERNSGEDGDRYERNQNSGAKLRLLLGTSPKANVVAVG